MKKLGLALCLLLLGLAPAQPQQAVVVPATMFSIQIAGTVAASAVLVAGVAGKSIYVTSINLVPVPTAAVTFTSGTGVGCVTGNANLTGVMTFAAGELLSLGSGYGAILVVPPGQSLCVTIATAAAPGSLTYALF